jgi:hypothetical protein
MLKSAASGFAPQPPFTAALRMDWVGWSMDQV